MTDDGLYFDRRILDPQVHLDNDRKLRCQRRFESPGPPSNVSHLGTPCPD